MFFRYCRNMELIVSLLLVILILLIFLISKRKYSNFVKLPGPRPNLFFGNMLDFYGSTADFLETLMRYLRTYGPIIRVYDGPFNALILITDNKFMEYILSSTKLIDKSTQYQFFRNWLGTGLLTSTGTKWKKRRRMITPSFHFSILENFVEVFESVGDVFIEKLEKEVGKNSVDIYPLVSLCTLDIICEAAMGTKVKAQKNGDSKYVKCVKIMCSIFTDRNFSPFDARLYPLTLNYYKEKMAVKILHAHTDKVIDERLKNPVVIDDDKENENIGLRRKLAFLDLLIKSNIDGKPLSRADIREEVDTFMFEGHDTTASAITFAIYALATNPDVQKKALDEQKRIFHDIKTAKATTSDLQNMKYLELVIKETLRLYPSVPYYGRNVVEDFEWEGTLYPKGLNLILFAFGSHRNSEYFPEPEKFLPERFENSDGKNPYVYIPFSAGPRNCIGQKFAMLEMKSTISKVLRNFELLPSKPEHKLQLAPETILVSKNGVCISLRRRSGIFNKY